MADWALVLGVAWLVDAIDAIMVSRPFSSSRDLLSTDASDSVVANENCARVGLFAGTTLCSRVTEALNLSSALVN